MGKNSVIGFGRVGFSAVLSLVTLPLLINALGVVDFGLFSALGGFVGLLSFVSTSLSMGSQREMTVALSGNNRFERLKVVLANCIVLHAVCALLVVGVISVVGYWYVTKGLAGGQGREHALVYALIGCVATVGGAIMIAPFSAYLVAMEDIRRLSSIEISMPVLGLIIAIFINFWPNDRLSCYGFLLAISALVNAVWAFWFTFHLSEARPSGSDLLRFDRMLLKRLLHFGGWNLFGSLAAIARFQGTAVLLNMGFGPTANASFAVAQRLGGLHTSLSGSVRNATNARITTAYATGNMAEALKLSAATGRYSFILACVWVFPLLLEGHFIFQMWLGKAPSEVLMMSLFLLGALTSELLTTGYMTLLQAIGRVAFYQSAVGGIMISYLPLAFFAIHLGSTMEVAFALLAASSVVAIVVRILFVRLYAGMDIMAWLRGTVLPLSCAVALAVSISHESQKFLSEGWIRLFATTAIFWVTFGLLVFWFVLPSGDRDFICGKISAKMKSGIWR